jgi:hypothetical protein
MPLKGKARIQNPQQQITAKKSYDAGFLCTVTIAPVIPTEVRMNLKLVQNRVSN